MIPAVKLNDSFAYLGKEFSFNMSNENVENDIVKRLSGYLEKLDILSLHPTYKINIVTKFVYSKFTWDLTIYQRPARDLYSGKYRQQNEPLHSKMAVYTNFRRRQSPSTESQKSWYRSAAP